LVHRLELVHSLDVFVAPNLRVNREQYLVSSEVEAL
jgi:hypothetical protein